MQTDEAEDRVEVHVWTIRVTAERAEAEAAKVIQVRVWPVDWGFVVRRGLEMSVHVVLVIVGVVAMALLVPSTSAAQDTDLLAKAGLISQLCPPELANDLPLFVVTAFVFRQMILMIEALGSDIERGPEMSESERPIRVIQNQRGETPYIVLYDHPTDGTFVIEQSGNLPCLGDYLDLRHHRDEKTWRVRGWVNQVIQPNRVVMLEQVHVEEMRIQ